MLIAAIVFLAVFTVLLLLLSIVPSGASQELKQTLARLDAIPAGARTGTEEALDVRRRDLLSTLPWLNRWLQKIEITRRLRLLLRQADLEWTVGRLVLLSIACGALSAYLMNMRTGALPFALFIGVAAGSLPLVYVLRKRSKRFARFEELLPEAVDTMVSAIRAGHGFNSAIGLMAKEAPEPIRREFRQCYDEQNFGLELRTAMSNLAERVPTPDVQMIVTAVLIQQENGGNLTEILDKAAQLIRERFRLQRQVRVHTAQGRMTAWVLSLVPIALGVVLYLMNPEQMSVLWTTPVGIKLLYTGAIMLTIGIAIIRKIVRMKV